MKNVLLGIVVTSVAAATAVLAFQTPSGGGSSTQRPAQKQKAERTTTSVENAKSETELDIRSEGTSCSLTKPPDAVGTEPGGVITWTIKGSCDGKISIEKITPPRGPFKTDGPKPAENGQQLHLYVNKGKVKGHWTYDVFFNAKPIQRAFKQALTGGFDLYVCPTWPCEPIKPPHHPEK